jgi:hypothetical protein
MSDTMRMSPARADQGVKRITHARGASAIAVRRVNMNTSLVHGTFG